MVKTSSKTIVTFYSAKLLKLLPIIVAVSGKCKHKITFFHKKSALATHRKHLDVFVLLTKTNVFDRDACPVKGDVKQVHELFQDGESFQEHKQMILWKIP